ncbi:uracil-DNA glycosylase family protein [Sorangium sp. So ce1151]|uniref:uracil-DNA glycosylase family protein n=1 Tax=Sorangium sp. So ce1151 TaxID=3133332 RepID=UPI003F6085C8
MNPTRPTGTYPFGSKLRPLFQEDRSPKRLFVLGVYASAVHAKWIGLDGRVLVRALAVASEPVIFWDGSGADRVIARIDVPALAGRLEPAGLAFNGSSGRSIDDDFLSSLGVARKDAWLCDLVPHTCLNPQQCAAIGREYEPRRHDCGLPQVDLPQVPRIFADDRRRAEVLDEIEEAQPEVIILLGDQPIRHFLSYQERRWRKLADFGDDYGRLHPVVMRDRRYQVLPLAHPRQVRGLGTHSTDWRLRHEVWKREVAPGLLGRPRAANILKIV